MKENLFDVVSNMKFAANSKAAAIIKGGSSKHSEIALAKALVTTKAYKESSELQEKCKKVLREAVEETAQAPEPPKRTTHRNGESCRY